MRYAFAEVAKIIGSRSVVSNADAIVDTVGFDSRRVHNASTTLFFAIDGKNRSGAGFVEDAYKKGVRCFVVPENFVAGNLPGANFIFVKHVLIALQKLAELHRQKFTGPVLGITGSNGKTIVKEWLYFLLRNDFFISRSPRSYNSSLGVACSLLGIETWHNMAVIEAGISQPGEMQVLEKMITPNLGIITHLGPAHDENFVSLEEKASEKVQLFANSDLLVYPYDSEALRYVVAELKADKPLLQTLSWGYGEGAKFRIKNVLSTKDKSDIVFQHRGLEHTVSIPFSDQASVENAMTCVCALYALERLGPEQIALFNQLQPLENRMVFSEGKRGNYIVNDSYSNDPDSLEVALDFLLRQQPDMAHVVVLSEFDQADKDKHKLYEKTAKILVEKNTNELVIIGKEILDYIQYFNDINYTLFQSTEELLESNYLAEIANKAILVKGSRRFKMERISEKLRKQLHQTLMNIDLNALRNNYTYFRGLLKPDTKIMAMVKAFGYGSGSFEAARTLQFMGANYLGVAYADEGIALRKAGITKPIMVMSTDATAASTLWEYKLEPVIYSSKSLSEFIETGIELLVHIEIDTGMHRLGFGPDGIGSHFENLPNNIKIQAVFSHLAASESEVHDEFTHFQIQKFRQACNEIRDVLDYDFIMHLNNTGGILRFPESQFDMVRLGIGLYGVDPAGTNNLGLEKVITLKSVISQIKYVAPGDSIGYSRKSIDTKERRIAIIPVGYADGLRRALGNGIGAAIIQGKPAPYLGNICMDMCMCDVTEIPCNEGDQVEIFGHQMPVEKVAALCDTIPYEIFTGISQRVRREYSGEN